MELPSAQQALQQAGFSAQAARFVALVVLSGGVFVREFASRWIGDDDVRRARTERFVDGEVSAAWRRAFGRDKGLVNQRMRSGVVYHCSGKALYRALGAENSRYRRPLEPADWPRIVERVLKVWAALASPHWPWLFSIEAQVALADSLGVSRSALPRRSYGVGQKQDVHFPDRPLIACAGDRLVVVRPHVDDDLLDPAASLRTWWRNYRPFIEAVGAAGVSVSLKLVRSAARPGDPAVDQLLALWQADGAAVEAVRDIWFARQEARRLEGGHPPVVAAYGGPDRVASRLRELEERLAGRRAAVAAGVADAEVWQAEGLPETW